MVACQWLARSGALPLIVYIDVIRRNDTHNPVDFSPLFDLLGKSVGRCHTLFLLGFKLNDFARVFNVNNLLCAETDSFLDYLDLRLSGEGPIKRRRSNYLLDISRHRPASISLFGISPSQLRSNSSWSKLTRAWLDFPVDSSCLVLEELMDLLESAHQLRTCWVNKLGGYEDQGSPRFHSSHRLVHRHLDDLYFRISDQHSSTIENLFVAVTLPSLHHVSIYNDCTHFPGNIMNSFLKRSGCRLRTLRAGFLPNSEDDEDLNRFIQANPHITSLRLSSVTDHFFNCLAIKPEDEGDEPPFLPCLDDFTYSGPRTFSWQAFEQILWRLEVIAKRSDTLAGPFYLCLTSEIEILNESLTRRLAILPTELLFDIYSEEEGGWISASLRHWGIDCENDDC